MFNTQSLYITRTNQDTRTIAVLTPNRLPAYLDLYFSDASLIHAQPTDVFSFADTEEVSLVVVEEYEDGSATYTARIDEDVTLLLCVNARGQVEHYQTVTQQELELLVA